MKINFDINGKPEEPTLILANRSGKKMGKLEAKGITMADYENEPSEIQFKIYKEQNGVRDAVWNNIANFKTVWCKDWDTWFEATIDLEETNETVKTVYCTKLGPAELSQIMLYNIEINTEDDIARDDYDPDYPTVLWNPDHPEASLLHRIMEKAPHYTITHVDSTIANIQRTYQFDGISLYDAFQEIAEEIGCLFVFPSASDEDGNIARTIAVYDLESNCQECGYRGDFTDVCPECGSTFIDEGYGEDTTIFITADELGETIQFTTDTDAVKNCFKLEAGDDLLTATVRNCNPNGSDYIYYISDETKEDMSEELVQRLADYDELYDYYQNWYGMIIPSDMVQSYNGLVDKYSVYKDDIMRISDILMGYPTLMNMYYGTIDFAIYLQAGLMPDASLSGTSAEEQAALLNAVNLEPVATTSIDNMSVYTASNAVLAMAKVIVDPRYQVKVISDPEATLDKSGTYPVWTGAFRVTNYSDDEDTADTPRISLTITDDYEEYLRQCINKKLNESNTENVSITGLFALDLVDFSAEIKKYCLDSLNMFYDACQSCLDILIEQGVADKQTWGAEGTESDLYNLLYVPYLNKQATLEAEIALRESEINIITGVYDEDGDIVTYGAQTYLEEFRNFIQNELDFAAYLGDDLWLEFCAYRREDKYSNDNYISDGLNNAELFAKAREFIRVAEKEIYKSAELQHSISATLRNLLMTEKFWPLLDYFEVGNWIRVLIDEKVYKLRLIGYEIDYDNLDTLSVDFSDVMKTADGISDMESVISQAATMATTYPATQKQASQGEKSNSILSNWVATGLDVTNTKIISTADGQTQTWDSHGMLFRKYNDITDTYDPTQLKIINGTMAITDDNWVTVKTAVGRYYYWDPRTQEITMAYGINAETLVGKLILGEGLGIYNSSNSLVFDEDGLVISNGINSFTVDPNSDNLVTISNKNGNILWVDSNGVLHISGDGAGLDISSNSIIYGMSTQIEVNANGIAAEITRATNAEGTLTDQVTQISITAEGLTSEVSGIKTNLDENYSTTETVSSMIQQLADSITLDVSGSLGSEAKIRLSVGGDVSDEVIDMTNVREAFANDESAVEIKGGLVRFDAGTLVISSGNFTLDSEGKIICSEATVNGIITTQGDKLKSTLEAGCLRIYYNDVVTGSFNSSYYANDESKTGVSFNASSASQYIAFGQSTDLGSIFSNYYYLINLGINHSGYTERHLFNGTIRTLGEIYLGTSSYYIFNTSTGLYCNGTITSKGELIAGETYYPDYMLSVYGSAMASGDWYTASDEQIKNDIEPLTTKTDSIIDKLSPISFRYKDGGKNHFGLTYQNVVEALNYANIDPDDSAIISTSTDNNGNKVGAIAYNEIIALLIYEIQKLKKEVQSLISE